MGDNKTYTLEPKVFMSSDYQLEAIPRTRPAGMRTVFIIGDQPRHLYYAARLAGHVNLTGMVVQKRGSLIPEPPKGLQRNDRANWVTHFERRAIAEQTFFSQHKPNLKYSIQVDDVNTQEVAEYVQDKKPDLVLVFGTGMIREPLMRVLPRETINLHLGLSPRYRGAATLFWPYYFLEPNHAGITLHRITAEPDAGDILHQARPPLKASDGMHDTAARAVITATNDMVELLGKRKRGETWRFRKQQNTGKVFLQSDFQVQHLRAIYNVWDHPKTGDRINAAFLNGEIEPAEPRLVYADNLEEVYA